jgi:integrase
MFEVVGQLCGTTSHLISYRQSKDKGAFRPIKNLGSSWYSVLRDCGLEGRHKFHSTKATFVTAVAMHAPAPVAQQLARHRDFETTRRYIRITDELSRKAVEAINFDLKPSQKVKSHTQKSHTKVNVLLPYMSKPL